MAPKKDKKKGDKKKEMHPTRVRLLVKAVR